MAGTARAQSATEYLITYSWAIIIIAVTLAALYALGLFNPSSFVSNQCIFPADFSCISGFFYSNGTLSINFVQATSTAINITAVRCNSDDITNGTNLTQYSPAYYVPVGGNITLTAKCYANGTVFTSQPGTLYRGYVIVNYTNLQTGFQHVLIGKILEKSS
ncbi:MAG: hypothetical protein KGI06_02955 [Candidatus Micrarchaeota archaeon]|nr:hypothetical protein [Candidatus Micrarchaeota archaeon]